MGDNHRLLILSCSQRKRPDPGYLPAIERYDGPAFRVVRRFLRERPDSALQTDIFVLSAAYGLISAEYPVAKYDQIMKPDQAAKLHGKVLTTFASVIRGGYTEFCLALSQKYAEALGGWEHLVPTDVSITLVDGPQGMRLAQLKHWLWGEEIQGQRSGEAPGHQMLNSTGMARLRGVELRLTSAQVLEQARVALVRNGANASRFQEWYVEVDSRRVAPKWLVSVLTGLPVRAFTAGEARRVLYELGLNVRQVAEERTNDHQSA